MPTQVNGLLVQKPDSPAPTAGQTQRFSWQELTGKSGKPYIRIKNEGKDYGSACEVVTAEKTDFTDTHGNVSFNVSFIPQDDAAGGVGEARQNGSSSAAPSDKDDAISRAVAAKIAGRVLSYEVGNNIHGDKPLDLAAATKRLAELTEAFLPIVTGAAEGKAEAPTTDRLDEGQPPF